MLERQLQPTLHRFAKAFPVVAITGSRQSGKTTLARGVFSDLKYVSLEDPSEFAFAQEDPKGFLARFAKGAVFDEAQRWPALFSYLQGMVDEDRTPGVSCSRVRNSSGCWLESPNLSRAAWG